VCCLAHAGLVETFLDLGAKRIADNEAKRTDSGGTDLSAFASSSLDELIGNPLADATLVNLDWDGESDVALHLWNQCCH